MTVTETSPAGSASSDTNFLWLDLTRKCQLECTHCYNASGPKGDHGTMTREDWLRSVDQAAANGVTEVQLIGGEPMLHPDAHHIATHALNSGLRVEIYSNLVHVANKWWELLKREGASLATSYYSATAEEHNAVTRRPSHGRTRANIAEAVRRGILVRVGIIGDSPEAAATAARDVRSLGVTRVGVDHIRPFGRATTDQSPSVSGLCGHCGKGRAAIGPDGSVAPCVFSGWMSVGNVRTAPLADILSGPAMEEAAATIRSTRKRSTCAPKCEPNTECTPGFPTSDCTPRN